MNRAAYSAKAGGRGARRAIASKPDRPLHSVDESRTPDDLAVNVQTEQFLSRRPAGLAHPQS